MVKIDFFLSGKDVQYALLADIAIDFHNQTCTKWTVFFKIPDQFLYRQVVFTTYIRYWGNSKGQIQGPLINIVWNKRKVRVCSQN